MRHFTGGHYLTENEKPRAEKARRAVRRFVHNLKRGIILAGCAAGAALIIGCGPDPVLQVQGSQHWVSINGHGCELATDCEHETAYHYGVNDCCYPPAMLYACERALDQAQTREQLTAAREKCGMAE